MRRLAGISIICFFVVALLFVSGKSLFFYEGRYQAPSAQLPSLEGVTVSSPTIGLFPEVPKRQLGTILVDLSHGNNFSPWEINVLLSRVVSRGFTVEYLKTAKSEETDNVSQQKRVQDLREELRSADAFVIISPQSPVSSQEVDLIKQFVNKGGKLLLVEDPTRRPQEYAYTRTGTFPISDISAEFGLIFENDYLYNLKENDGNYRYISFRDFSQSELTSGLNRITLYCAGSIRGGTGVVFTDENTLASNIEAEGKLSPIALAADSKVLGIYNLTFMIEPFNASFDNDRLISNICDWLTTSERTFTLSDFPYFLKEAPLVTYADVSLLRTGIELNNLLVDLGKNPRVVKYEEGASLSQDAVFIGLFKDATEVNKFLERGNITCTDTNIEVKGIGTVPQAGISIIYLSKEGDTNLLVILADTEKRLQQTCDILKRGEFRQWRVSDMLAIYQPADFSLSGNPSTISFTPDGSATFNVSITPSGRFADTVGLTSGSTPVGLTVTPASATVTSPYPTTTFTVASSTPGTYTVTITGTSGTLTHITMVAVTVKAR